MSRRVTCRAGCSTSGRWFTARRLSWPPSFLFTVHFFNNHFRPDKLPPPDIVMFTGTQSIEEFRHDHPAQYQRLVDAGELEKYLVDAPSAPLARGSKILGLVLIAAGLILLVLVSIGFFGG